MSIQTNKTENNSYGSQSGFGGMDQVSSGPAGLLYSLSNQLIKVYNELQDLYGKVAVAETSVQQETINAGAAAQIDAAEQQKYGMFAQAAEALAGAAITGITTGVDSYKSSDIYKEMGEAEAEKAPLEKLDELQKGTDPASHLIGNPPPNAVPADITARVNELKNGNYAYNVNNPHDMVKNQRAINQMSPDEFAQFKKDLDNKIMDKDKRVNTLQTRRQTQQTSYNTYSQIATQMANTVGKGVESSTTAKAGQAQALQQTSSGVQQMAGSTADSSRGSIGQDYAKVSDAIAAARQGAQAYAQT